MEDDLEREGGMKYGCCLAGSEKNLVYICFRCTLHDPYVIYNAEARSIYPMCSVISYSMDIGYPGYTSAIQTNNIQSKETGGKRERRPSRQHITRQAAEADLPRLGLRTRDTLHHPPAPASFTNGISQC